MFQNPLHLFVLMMTASQPARRDICHGSLRPDDTRFGFVHKESTTAWRQPTRGGRGLTVGIYDCSGTWVLMNWKQHYCCHRVFFCDGVLRPMHYEITVRENYWHIYFYATPILLSNQNLITLTWVSESGFQFHQIWYKNQTGFRWFWIPIGIDLSRIYSE